MMKHLTSSVFVLDAQPDYRIALLRHKRFGKWMIPGGHVESWENPFEAAQREVHEETGLKPRFITFEPERAGMCAANAIPRPEIIVEEEIPSTHAEPAHIHIDFLYIAVADQEELGAGAVESAELRWFHEHELDGLDMFPETRDLAKEILAALRAGNSFRPIRAPSEPPPGDRDTPQG